HRRLSSLLDHRTKPSHAWEGFLPTRRPAAPPRRRRSRPARLAVGPRADLGANEPPPQLPRRDARGATATERVQHQRAGLGQLLDQVHRLTHALRPLMRFLAGLVAAYNVEDALARRRQVPVDEPQ